MNNDKGCINHIEETITVLVLMYFGVLWLIVTALFQDLQIPVIKSKQNME